ncbi:MAG TPA: hypothetical protein DD435_04550 [Cyanobacteria bacterium UBA8530]|nr:hypothetical protein [Cyanobacteria bacterium UBA8530]
MKKWLCLFFSFFLTLPVQAEAQLSKAVWIRPYLKDATENKVKEVFDNVQGLGAKNVYLETFWGGQTIFPSKQFPQRFPGVDLLETYRKEAKTRGMKLYSWIHSNDFGKAYADRFPEDLALDGFGKTSQATEPHSWMVSPALPQVRERLANLAYELCQRSDGVILDYIRYPVRIKGDDVDESPDPRNFWGYNPKQLIKFFLENPEYDSEEYRSFLASGQADPSKKEEYLGVWKDWNAYQVEELIQRIRRSVILPKKLGISFFPNYYFHINDSRLQESKKWFSYFDLLSPMCYSYYLDRFPGPFGDYNIDRELGIVEEGLLDQKRKPPVMASLTEDPPGTPLHARFHHRIFREQIAYLRGRMLDLAYPNLKGIAYFSYGWLFPESEKNRKTPERESR